MERQRKCANAEDIYLKVTNCANTVIRHFLNEWLSIKSIEHA